MAAAREGHVGEPIVLELRVDDFETCEPPEFPASEDYHVRPGRVANGSQTDLDLGTGRRIVRRWRTYSFELTPRKAGVIVVPAIAVVVDGQVLRTRPISIRAEKADQPLLAEITTDLQRLYVGQKARFKLSIWIRPAVAPGRRTLTGHEMFNFIDERSGLGPFRRPEGFSEHTRTLDDGTSQRYYVYPSTAEVVIERPGPLTFDELEIGMAYPTGFARDVFGDLRVTEWRRLRVKPTVLAPDALPLPDTGRPANFTGAVGVLEFNAFARPTTVRVGDPIELVMEISGDGPLETLQAPVLAAQPGFLEQFRVPNETLAGTMVGDHKQFTQTIRATRADVNRIPPIEYPYFDPLAGQYRVARSAGIPITVTRSEELETAELTGISSPAPERQAQALDVRDGLLGNKTAERELLANAMTITPTHVWLATVAPPGVFLAALCWTALARASAGDAARRRRQSALHNAMGRVVAAARRPAAERGGEIVAALAGYVADRFDQPPGLTGHEALAALARRGVDPQTLQRCRALIERCEAAAYGGLSPADAELAEEARACLAALERERRL